MSKDLTDADERDLMFYQNSQLKADNDRLRTALTFAVDALHAHGCHTQANEVEDRAALGSPKCDGDSDDG